MKGDFSRSTHRPANRYSSVRLQQGRVLLDAEWNEQVDLALHRERTTGIDTIGRTGAPKHAPSEQRHFGISLSEDSTGLLVAPGRIYVDGILCENHAAESTPVASQPDFPGFALPDVDGAYAIYLDVWERHVTTVDQSRGDFPPLREAALGGPDTATRTKVVWQVKLAAIDSRTCGSFVPPTASTGRLRARAVPSEEPGSDCLVPAGGGYRRLENQLYRIEIHDEAAGVTRFKWSRDNGSIASRVRIVDDVALTITVEDPGRDETLGFASARFVELTDDERVLRNEPGVLLEVQTVSGDSVRVLNPDALSLAIGTNATLRRWDGLGEVSAGTPIDLEDGVQIEFDGGTLTTGDYWLVPARTLTGQVEWPTDGADPPQGLFEARHGTEHHYCPLAVVSLAGGTFSQLADCRPLFPPLTDIAAADVSYDNSRCDNLTKARTVQQALDILCKATGGTEPGIHIEKIALISGRALENDAVVPPAELARGLSVTCDQRLFQDSVRNLRGQPNPVCRVTLDLPWPTASEREQWRVQSFGVMGYTTITLNAQVNADDNVIFWTPQSAAPNDVVSWLNGSLLGVLEGQTHGQMKRVLARLHLKGNFIWGGRSPLLYLDGEVFGAPGRNTGSALQLPSGDGRRGGDFEMWFWLGIEEAPPVRPGRVGVIPGRLSRFLAAPQVREAINLGIQRDLPALRTALPPNYDVDQQQRFDANAAATLMRQVGVRGLSGLCSTRFQALGTTLSAMFSGNMRVDAQINMVEDNVLLRQVRAMMAAGNPPDFVVGDEELMAALNTLTYSAPPMIAI